MMKRIVFTNFGEADLTPDLWDRVRRISSEHVLASDGDPKYEELVAEADGLILRLGGKADTSRFEKCPKLRYVGMFGTGYGRIDTTAARSRGVTVTNVADYSTESVAELTIALALLAKRHLIEEITRARALNVDETELEGRDLSSLTFGIVGAGNIGQRVARILRSGFDADVQYWSRTRKPELEALPGIRFASLDELVASSDVVSIHLASNDETNGLLDAKRIGQIRAGGVLINTAPNELIDIPAVLAACGRGALTFAMDHADELEAADRERLIATPNVLTLPPVGYATAEASRRKMEILVENLESFAEGGTKNVVN